MICLLLPPLLLLPAVLLPLRLKAGWEERVGIGYLVLTAEIFLLALIASASGELANDVLWTAGAFLAATGAIFYKRDKQLPVFRMDSLLRFSGNRHHYSLLLWLPLFALMLLTLYSGLSRAPGNWDGVSYQLPRALYYLQFGSFADYPTPTSTQVLHPLLGTCWLIATMLAGGMNERLFFLPQFLSWLVTAAALLGLANQLVAPLSRPKEKLIFGQRAWLIAVFSLLSTVALLEADTEKTDLLLACYVALAFFFAASSLRAGGFLSMLSFAFALAVKGSALPVAPLWALAFIFLRKKNFRAETKWWAFGAVVAIFVLTFSGYGRNILRYHAPLGPKTYLASYEFSSARESLSEGTANVFRYAIEAGTPDGWPGLSLADDAVFSWRKNTASAAEFILGRPLTEGRTFGGYETLRPSLAHEDTVSFGFAYFLLFLCLSVRFLLCDLKNRVLLFLFSGILFTFLFHCYFAVYDRWHGRFFLVGLVFLAPFLALSAERWLKESSGRAILCALFTLLFAQSFYTIFHRNNVSLAGTPGRLAQVLRDRPYLVPVFSELDKAVPSDALLATKLSFAQPEYALFGPSLSRIVIPTVDFQHGVLPLPPSASWLLFTSELEPAKAGDLALGENYFLRKLRP